MTIVIDAHVTVGSVDGRTSTIDELVEAMDTSGVDAALTSPDAAGLAANHEAALAPLLQARADYPGRILPYASISPWRPDAMAWLERALDDGCVGIKIDPFRQGHLLIDPILNPVLEVAEARRVPVYLSSGTPLGGMPLQARVVARRWPSINFILGRSGRTDFARDLEFTLRGLTNLLIDTAHGVSDVWPGDFAEGPWRDITVFSTDWPWSAISAEIAKVARFVADYPEASGILGTNILSILPDDAAHAITSVARARK